MSMLPPAMTCAPGFTLPRTSTEPWLCTSCPPRSVRFTTSICTSFLSASGSVFISEDSAFFLPRTAPARAAAAAPLTALTTGFFASASSFISRKYKPCCRKSFFRARLSFAVNVPVRHSMTVPRRKNRALDSSFSRISRSTAENSGFPASTSRSPVFSPLNNTLSFSMISSLLRACATMRRTKGQETASVHLPCRFSLL